MEPVSPDTAEISQASKTSKEVPPKPESIKGKHFEYTLVFGQGPAQESDGIPKSGREGLNFYSRMTALAASQMLKNGITERVILSGSDRCPSRNARSKD